MHGVTISYSRLQTHIIYAYSMAAYSQLFSPYCTAPCYSYQSSIATSKRFLNSAWAKMILENCGKQLAIFIYLFIHLFIYSTSAEGLQDSWSYIYSLFLDKDVTLVFENLVERRKNSMARPIGMQPQICSHLIYVRTLTGVHQAVRYNQHSQCNKHNHQ